MEGAVGIFLVRCDDLWIDSTPVSDAADYGALKTHDTGHPSYWEQFQERGAVPRDEEYGEVPRGRVNLRHAQEGLRLFALAAEGGLHLKTAEHARCEAS